MGTLTRSLPGNRPGTDGTGGPRQRGRGRRRGGGRPKALRRTSWLGPHRGRSIAALCVTGVVVVASLWAYVAYRNVYDAIHREDVTSQMLGPRPPKLNGSLNVLMIGSDSRKGMHGYGRGIQGSRSDTAMLLHISPTHQLATVISFPRDSMVPVYKCLPDRQGHVGQQAAPGQVERLNATFSYGGVPCLWKTLEQATHLHIDHFMEVNFLSFKKIVNDIGGVPVCLPYPIHDYRSKLRLAAGRHVVNGAQALAFVRVRHVGDGSDLERIKRQQLFLAAVARKMRKSGLLSNPTRTYGLVHDVAGSLTVDSGLSLTTMYSVAGALRNLTTTSLHFISVPVVPYPGDPMAEVQWAPTATSLFSAIAHDNQILKAASDARKGTKASPAPTVDPANVQVQVLNGSGTSGLAGTAASDLASRGFNVTGTGNAPTFGYTSNVIEYGSVSQLPEVDTLKKQVPDATVKKVPGLGPGAVSLILGSDFNGLSGQGPGHKQSVRNLAKNYGGITGNTNMCHDSAAWAP
jgi:LCP family protein required for cell wall assembly